MAMRLVIDSLIALMLVGILAAVLVHQHDRRQETQRLEAVHVALRLLERQVLYQAAVDELEVTDTGFPLTVSPGWFQEGVPMNLLVPPSQPWLDIAPPGDSADHPPDPVIHTSAQAGFWYNPQRGVFRARVMPELTDAATLRRYNEANATVLLALPGVGDEADRYARQPQPVRVAGLVYAGDDAQDAEMAAQVDPQVAARQGVVIHAVSHTPAVEAGSDPDPAGRPTLLRR